MTTLRVVVLAVVASLLIAWGLEPEPPPLKPMVMIDYCVVSYRVQGGWGYGFGPCNLLDKYEEI